MSRHSVLSVDSCSSGKPRNFNNSRFNFLNGWCPGIDVDHSRHARSDFSDAEQLQPCKSAPLSEDMKKGMAKTLRRALCLMIVVPIVALAFSRSVAGPYMACPQTLANGSSADIHRSDFPKGFVFGSATAAYQVEGATGAGGRGPSIWDVFSHTPGKILGDGNGDVAVDQYHRYEEDIDLLNNLGMEAYRLSISWSRILPDGYGPTVNEEGIAHYNRLIDALLRKGVAPYVTLYHWDLPQNLQDLYNGWPSKEVVPHFAFFAEVCFAAFGDRVKHWITFNEPVQFTWLGYGEGIHAPGRTSERSKSPGGNSSTEPYLAAHNVILAHGTAVDVYRKKFQKEQGGSIGITCDMEWGEPMTDSPEDAEAAERRRLFQVGWILDPIFFGDYPAAMRVKAGSKLPTFSEEEKSLLSGSLDFIGLNHYTTRWVTSSPPPNDPLTSNYYQDQSVQTSDIKDGVYIGEKAYSFWLISVPWGVEKLIIWTWERYGLPIYITENGLDTENLQPPGTPLPVDFARDPTRITYFQNYLAFILSAVRKGADVKGYFAWSLLDNFEWAVGYTSRFGLHYTDFNTLTRYPKDSARWWAKFLHARGAAEYCHLEKDF